MKSCCIQRLPSLVFLFLASANVGLAFVHSKSSLSFLPTTSNPAKRGLSAVDFDAAGEARAAFIIWFFGGSGGVGIALSAFPRMFSRFQQVRALGGTGPTQGGPFVGISPFCLYPADIAIADVEQICKTRLSIEQIVEKYPVEGNFLSSNGYLTFDAFQMANAQANPLAVRVIFDTFNAGSDVSSPTDAQEVMDELKLNPTTVADKVLASKLKGYSAISALMFLLLLAVYQSTTYFREGWFPEWPGLTDLPWSLLDSETGLTAIPRYWLGDI